MRTASIPFVEIPNKIWPILKGHLASRCGQSFASLYRKKIPAEMLHCLYCTRRCMDQSQLRLSRNVNSVIYFKELIEEFITSQNYYYLFLYSLLCSGYDGQDHGMSAMLIQNPNKRSPRRVCFCPYLGLPKFL